MDGSGPRRPRPAYAEAPGKGEPFSGPKIRGRQGWSRPGEGSTLVAKGRYLLMKMTLFSRLVPIAVLACAAQTAFAKDISFNDLPAPAKREAQTELKSGTLKKVESVNYQGHTIYALTFQRPDGAAKYIYLNADGTYVHDQSLPNSTPSSATPATAAGTEVQLNQLPPAVQRTIQTELRNGPVARILQVPHPRSPVYEVFFREPNGQMKTIYLNPDGSYAQNAKAATTGTGHSWDTLSGSGGSKK
jgi:hypothetical protein